MVEKEQQSEKKKQVSCKRFFKYLGLGLLIFMLAVSIIFQAPWKVITILTVILACYTILPKKFRKWFWLSTAVIVIALVVWVFLPEDNKGWRPYIFEEEMAALEAKYAVPDEENAALLYDEIIEGPGIDSNAPDFFVRSKPSSKDGPWLSKDHPEMAQWLEGRQDTIGKLLQAAKKDKCIFLPIGIDYMDFGNPADRFLKVRSYAFLLISAANNDIAEGRIDAGIEKVLCILRIADHMYQQPISTLFLKGFGLERLALIRLNKFIMESEPTTEQLRLIINASGDLENNWSTIFKRILELDKLTAKNSYCSIFYEVNPEGKTRFSRDPSAKYRKEFPEVFPPPNYLQRKLCKARTILPWLVMPSTPKEAGQIYDDSFDVYNTMTEPDFHWEIQARESGYPLTRKYLYRIRLNLEYIAQLTACMPEESYYSLHDAYLKNLAIRRGPYLLIAIKKYHSENGNWPDSLNDIAANVPAETLIDPASGNEFEYENHGQNFSLFGENINIWPK
jgi:hypothetical protein